MLVVLHHAIKVARDRLGSNIPFFHIGNAGVDIFFAISGLVIVLSSVSLWGEKQAAWKFLRRRFIRVVPLYWLATMVKLALVLAQPGLAQHTRADAGYVLDSLLFIPAWNASGEALPLIPPGWTLSFEMLFYCIFSLALIGFRRPLLPVGIMLAALTLLGLSRSAEWGAPATLLSPLLLEFLGGMAVASLVLERRRIPLWLALGGVGLFVAGLGVSWGFPEYVCLEYRLFFWGVPGMGLLLGAVGLESRLGPWLRGLPNRLGNASYSIYLSHGFALQACALLWTHLPPGRSHLGQWAFIVTGFFLSAAAGIFVWRWVERPLLRWIEPARPTTTASP